MTPARRSLAIVLLLAAGLVGCTDDDADTDAAATIAAESPPRTLLSRRRSSSPSACVTTASNEFADPQIRADGDFFLSPPADVGDEELRVAEEACEHIPAGSQRFRRCLEYR